MEEAIILRIGDIFYHTLAVLCVPGKMLVFQSVLTSVEICALYCIDKKLHHSFYEFGTDNVFLSSPLAVILKSSNIILLVY